MRKIKYGFDAGHGFYTSGKRTPDGEREWTFNNKVALAFEKEMLTYENVELKRFDDRTGKTDVPLKTRTDGANKWGADYYISFHHNGLAGKYGSHGGVETHVYENTTNSKSVALANAIQPVLVKAYGLRDRGVKKSNLHITRETTCAAVLIEGGFMDSLTDIKALRNDAVLAAAGKAIAQAAAKVSGLKKKVVASPKPVTKPAAKPVTPAPIKNTTVKDEMNMKMVDATSKYVVDEIAKVYKEAYDGGTLSSDQWYKKAKAYEITVAEVAYVTTMLVSRIGI